jgi:hypothetical protein
MTSSSVSLSDVPPEPLESYAWSLNSHPQIIENIIEALCSGIHGISDAFEIPFVSAVGAAADSEASASVFGAGNSPKTGKPVDEYDVMRSLDLMKKGDHQDAYELLQAALRKQKR